MIDDVNIDFLDDANHMKLNCLKTLTVNSRFVYDWKDLHKVLVAAHNTLEYLEFNLLRQVNYEEYGKILFGNAWYLPKVKKVKVVDKNEMIKREHFDGHVPDTASIIINDH